MKKWFTNLMVAFLFLTGGHLMAQVSVTATAGAAGPTAYTTLNAAFTAINAGTHQGAITVAITGNTTEPAATVALLRSNSPSSYTSILIRPSGGNFTINSAATPTASRGVIELSGADNVTIDGDDPATAGTRNLTIAVATNTTTGTAAVRLSSNSTTGADGADNNSVKNCVIIGGRSTAISTTVSYGINMSNYSSTSMTTGAYSSLNTVIENNLFTRAYYGVYANGSSSTYPNTGTVVRSNTFGSSVSAENIGRSCVFVAYTAATTGAALVELNDMRGGDYGTTGYSSITCGVEVAAGNFGIAIRRNNMHDFSQPSTGGYMAAGVYISSATGNTLGYIQNNVMRDMVASNYSQSYTAAFVNYGIYCSSAITNYAIDHNTIVLKTANSTGTTTNPSSVAVLLSSASATLSSFRNNIIVNSIASTNALGVYTGGTGVLSGAAVNNNDYYIPTGKVGYYGGVARTSLSDWQSATGKDLNSVSVSPAFVSATDMHIVAGTVSTLESGGATASATGVAVDIDGDSRPGPAGSTFGGATAPDMGADEFDGALPSCFVPNGLTAAVTSTSTATLSWTAPTPAPSLGYEYEVRSSGNAGSGPTGLFVAGSTGAGVLTASIVDLTPNTTYAVYVRSHCGTTEFSAWSSSSTLYTGYCIGSGLTTSSSYYLTNVTVAGYNTTLNNTSVAGTGGYSDFTAQSASGYAGSTASVSMATSTSSSYFYVWVDWNNDFDFADAGETLVATTSYAATYSGTITIPATASLGAHRMRVANSGVGVITSCGVSPYGEYEDYIFNVVAPPACVPVTGLTVTGLTTSSATFSWTAPAQAPSNGYDFEVRTSGAPESGATGFVTNGSVAAGITTATAAGLTPNTSYTVYVRSNCAGSGNSTWSSGATFYTGYCIPVGLTTSSSYYITNVSVTNAIGNINNTSVAGTNGYTNYSASVAASAYPGQTVNFSVTPSSGTNYFYVWVDWNNDLDFADANETLVATSSYTANFSGTYTIPAVQALGSFRMRVALSELGVITACGPAPYGEYEDYTLNIITAPTCFAPTALAVSNVTNNSATLSWTAATPAPSSGYEYYLSTSATAPTAATPATGTTAAGVVSVNVSALAETTTYYFWVRSVCSGSDSSAWSSATSFATYCAPVTTFSENFDSVTTPALPACWSKIIRGTSTNLQFATVNTVTTNFSAPNGVNLYNSGIETTDEVILVSPYLSNLNAGTHQLRFRARNGTASQDVIVGTVTGTGSNAVFTAIQTVDVTTDWQEFTLSFASYAGSNKLIAFKHLNTSTYTTIYLDNISWEVIPTCFPPTAVTATLPTTTGITLNWTAPTQGTPVSYAYEIRTSGAAGSGAAGLAASGTVPAGTTSALVNTLNGGTTYNAYIRTSCGGTDNSFWTTLVSFTTVCVPIATLPWTENFDAMTTLGTQIFPNCWFTDAPKWSTSNATTYNTPRSGANYARYAYSSTNAFLWTPGFALQAGKAYNFSFYAQGDGYTGYNTDIFVNSSQSPTGATQVGTTYVAPGTGTIAIQPYVLVTRTFTPTADGTYYFGIRGNQASSTPWYMAFDDFNVSEAPTSVTSFTPSTVCQGGGTTVTITGTSFNGATAVSFNGTAAQSFAVVNNSTITAVTPAGITAGPISVTATLGTGVSSSNMIVNPMPIVNPITNGNASLCVNGTIQLGNTSPGGTWGATDPAIASVSTGGLVTANASGTTTITYSVTDNGCTTTVSTPITVNSPVSSTNPENQTAVTGDDVTFSVVATGPVTGYQWQISEDGGDNYVNIAESATYEGTMTATLTIHDTPDTLNDVMFRAIVFATSPCANVETNGATLLVGDTGIETDPTSVTLCSPGLDTAVFNVVATGSVTDYSWEVFQTSSWLPINDVTVGGVSYSGSNTNQLTVSGLSVPNSGWQFRAVVTGFGEPVYSNAAILTVNSAVSVTSNPSSAIACSTGQATTLTAEVSGTVSSLQWKYFNGTSYVDVANNTPVGVSYSGNTTNQLIVTNGVSTPLGAYMYKLFVNGTSPCGNVESDAATVTVTRPTITVTPSSAAICNPGGSAVTLTAGGAVSYSWSPATGLSATTGATVSANPSATTTYTVTGTDVNGCTSSSTVVVTVNPNVSPVATATPSLICVGAPVQLEAKGGIPFVTGPVTSYVFTSTTAAYNEVSAGATTVPAILTDTAVSGTLPIGFTFNYGGLDYTQFKMDSNGLISFNTSASSLTTNNFSTANATSRPIIAPLWDDMDGRATGGSFAGYEVSGTAPNRVLTAEWRNWEWNYNSSSAVISFQVKLYETTNVVEFAYRSEAGAVNSGSASIGIGAATGNGNGSYLNVTTVPATAVSSTSAVTNIATKPATNTVYRFTPGNTPVFTYAWTSIPAGFTSSVANPVVNPTQNTTYNVVVTTAAGCSSTASTSVTIQSGASITTQPVASTKCQGETVTLNVVAMGPGLTYQWRKGGVNIAGNASATTSTLTLTAALPAVSGNYDVVVTPSCGDAVISESVAVLVNPTPTATAPAAQSVCTGSATPVIALVGTPSGVTFDITGGASIGLANQTNVTSIPSFTAISGSATLTITPKANGCAGTPVTAVFTVVGLPSAVSVTPTSVTMCAGDAAVALTATGGVINNASYCTPSMSTASASGDYIANFTFGGINNSTGDTPTDYTYYNTLTANVTAGVATPVSFTSLGISSTYAQIFRVWVDLNQDGQFTASESVFVTTTAVFGTTAATGNITIPISALNGVTRMRVGSRFSSAPTASAFCLGESQYGEFEDYNINITGGTSNYVWSPAAGLYTNAAATNAYVAGTKVATVYAKPTATSSYSATVTGGGTCSTVSNTVTVTVNQYYDFYVDADFDGYGTGSQVLMCATSATTPPTGYAVVGGDCNDSVAAINPGHAEVPYNGVDDNCNGTIDEGSQIMSQVLASQCGTTLAAINSAIGAVSFPAPVDGYRFRVVNTTTNAVQTIDRTQPNFQLTALATYDYATTYSISVMVRRNGIWLNYYGPSCLVSTPAVLDAGGAASVTPSQCGVTLPSISTLIATTSLQGVTGYRFRITNITDPTAPNQVQTLDRVTHWFSLTMLSTYVYGTTYTVEVALKTGNSTTYSGYGAPCQVSTPAVPVITNPGTATSTTMLFNTVSMNRATSYRFELTLAVAPFTTIIVDRTSHYFSFSNVPGYIPGGQYAVRVAVMTSGVWSPFGEAELVTAPGATRGIFEEETGPSIAFRAVAYPNPYAEGFALDMDTPSDERVNVKVYDMVGKLLEDSNFAVDAIEVQQFGVRYPSGVYNVIVTQGNFVKTLRVIKR
ncbi:GEVED domain-containing protein [Flavobacterium sp.]|uniref:GEVED domain-containing protein n=1 Tax=Flavobacterium sp. TaxID=239 RepID=UPI0025B9CC4F|nr:GEVED domain-containing protein [Flavobacterium sp.]